MNEREMIIYFFFFQENSNFYVGVLLNAMDLENIIRNVPWKR